MSDAIDKQLEFLDSLQRHLKAEFDRKAREQEERRKWYEETASQWLKKPVAVKFCQIAEGYSGIITNNSTAFEISLVPCPDLVIERSCFCHEIGHGLMNHGSGWTEEGQKKGDLMHEVLISPELSKRLDVDVKAWYQTEYRKRRDKVEQEADLIGEKLFHFYWPEDEYIPHNSTELQMQIKFK